MENKSAEREKEKEKTPEDNSRRGRTSDEKISSPTYELNHDDEVFEMLCKILTADVMYSFGDENEKIYQLIVEISPDEIFVLTEKMKVAFLEQPTLLRIGDQPIVVVADMHGQIIHLLRILLTCEPPPDQRYLFLGDYVDRGSQSIVVICLLFCLKHRYPQNVFLLRGNHEDINTTLNYGFYDECLEQFKNESIGEKVWKVFIETFNCMPLAAVVGGKVFCAHGGISPWMDLVEDINTIERPLVVPPFGLACDLLWSDPTTPEKNGWGLSHRGISFTYGRSCVDEFCARNDISFIIRGHQLFKEMYPFGCVLRFGGRLMSLFSALNYECHKNNCSVLKLEFTEQQVHVKQVLFRCRFYALQKPMDILAIKDMRAASKQQQQQDTKRRSWSKLGNFNN